MCLVAYYLSFLLDRKLHGSKAMPDGLPTSAYPSEGFLHERRWEKGKGKNAPQRGGSNVHPNPTQRPGSPLLLHTHVTSPHLLISIELFATLLSASSPLPSPLWPPCHLHTRNFPFFPFLCLLTTEEQIQSCMSNNCQRISVSISLRL